MEVVSTVAPVFIMILLGYIANRRNLVTADQTQSMNAVMQKLFFPIMVFNAIFTSNIEVSSIVLITFVFVAHIFAFFIGKMFGRVTSKEYQHISPYLMCTVDGGNICFPLYATIVGSSFIGNIILLDIACIFMVFIVIPLLVANASNNSSDVKGNIKRTLTNPFIITLILAFSLKIVGLYNFIIDFKLDTVYTGVVNMITAPIIPIILFTIGFQFKIQKASVMPILKSMLLRISIMVVVIFSILNIFENVANNYEMFIAVILYFMCPPALIIQTQVSDLCKDEKDENFLSAFVSLYMVFTLVIYTVIIIYL